MDYNDCIYKTQREKYNAIMDEIEECHRLGQPVLVGTVSVDASETDEPDAAAAEYSAQCAECQKPSA